MSLNSPCWALGTWWNGGNCLPAWNGPWLLIGELRVTKLGPWLCAWLSGVCVGLGSRTKALFPWVQAALAACVYQTHLRLSYGVIEAGGHSPGRVSGVTPQGLSVGCMLTSVWLRYKNTWYISTSASLYLRHTRWVCSLTVTVRIVPLGTTSVGFHEGTHMDGVHGRVT